MFGAGKTHNESILRGRFAWSFLRVRRISHIAEKVRPARKLHSGGAHPMATWGQSAVGPSAAYVDKLRVMVGLCTGIDKSGRCLTTARAVSHGGRGDPWLRVIKDTITAWLPVALHLSQRFIVLEYALLGPAASSLCLSRENTLATCQRPYGRCHSSACICRLAPACA